MRTIEEAYQARCAIHTLFDQRPDSTLALIQSRDREWFDVWVEEHRPPGEGQASSPSR